ncbi:RNAse P Rpr2/Rpp21/SNM1 subunit domain-containing protein [Glomus cerebriforme]|uniref:RNAse P Rpr2/Rpp21/SNM1 subunit domain-containing protein n=1 Tax=Glomus cerebriforme TaxID=658196 RepID=A0A397TBY3_9GLOM|nr:RNAse P Rpr2/Rpp21/SNM1 subunit domain-containing protein [Glomus cerebriforme]
MATQDTSTRLQFLWNASHTFLPTIPSLSAFYMQQFNQFSAEKELNLAEAVKRKYCSYCGSIFLPGLNSQVRIEKKKKRKRGNKKKNSTNKEGQAKVFKQIKQEKKSQDKRGKRQIICIYPFNHDNNLKKQTHSKLQHKNHVSYVCNSCNRETRFVGSIMKDIKEISNVKQQKEYNFNFTTSVSQDSTSYKISSSNSSLSVQNKSSHCKTKKKQKKMQLQQLLAEEKRKSTSRQNDFNDSSDGLSLTNFLSAL